MMKLERAITDLQIQQILDLQQQNLKKNLSSEEVLTQGFVTAEHNFGQLKRINDAEPSIIATENGQLVAYAIAMRQDLAKDMPVFETLLKTVDNLTYKDKSIKAYSYIFIGQLCVDKNYRGSGLVKDLYAYYKTELSTNYDFAITDISEQNVRSLKAHQKCGFEKIHTFFDEYTQSNWHVVVMDFNK